MATVVRTASGPVRGAASRTPSGCAYRAFYKIPYARPPVGELRFALPRAPEPWRDVLDCSKRVSSACLQVFVANPESKITEGSEDCLYLNVFTPVTKETPPAPLPVLVYFHGGAFCVGSSDPRLYGPELLVGENVVYVSVNYRLGPLGFFSLGCDAAPGNQGLHDQVLALEWVRDNVAAFGGDGGRVTLAGESAGAMACFLHLVSPRSRGLFHQIVALSGTGTTPFLHTDRKPEVYGRAFASHFGCNSDDSADDLLKRLRSLSAREIILKTTLFKDWDPVNPLPWKPVLDDYASTPFLPKKFKDCLLAGEFDTSVPILTGFTSEEGLIFTAPFHKSPKIWPTFFKEWDTWAPLLFFNRETDLTTDADVEAVGKIRSKFFPDLGPDAVPLYDRNHLKCLETIFSVGMFQAPLIHDMDILLRHGVKLFTYNFSYRGSMTLLDIFRLPTPKLLLSLLGRKMGFQLYQKDLGACHADDLLYIFPFNRPPLASPLKTEKDREVSSWMVSSIGNFVKTGSPNGENFPQDWPQFEGKTFLNFGNSLSTSELPQELQDRIKFWNELVIETKLLERQLFVEKVQNLHAKPAAKRSKAAK